MDAQMINAIKQAKNLIGTNNPQVQQMMNLINSSGKAPEQMVRDICQQKNIDVDELLNELRN